MLARVEGKLREARLLRFVGHDTRDRALIQFDDGSQQLVESSSSSQPRKSLGSAKQFGGRRAKAVGDGSLVLSSPPLASWGRSSASSYPRAARTLRESD